MQGNKLLTLLFSLLLVFGLGLVNSNYVYAADEYEIGISNLNGTLENSSKVGEALTQPEKGWKRYDDSNKNIVYSDNSEFNQGLDYQGKSHYLWPIGPKNVTVNFKFYGTKLRILGAVSPYYINNAHIRIDSYEDNFNEQYSKEGHQIVLYESNVMEKDVHNVTITYPNDSKLAYDFDALDIDENGELLPYDEGINIDLVKLDKTKVSLKEGEMSKLTATTTSAVAKVKWSASDESVATVDQNGKVTGIKEGKCTITAQIEGSDSKATCEVTVTTKGAEGSDDTTENIINIAHAKGSNTNNASGECVIIFHGSADTILEVVKTADVKEVWVGDTFYYTITVTNTGSKTAKAVVINDDAPNHIEFNVDGVTTTQGSVDSSSTFKNLIVNVGDIEPSQTVTINIPVIVVE